MLLQQTTLAGPSHLRTSTSIKFIRRGSEGGESGGGENLSQKNYSKLKKIFH
jgi:hypothetical protein